MPSYKVNSRRLWTSEASYTKDSDGILFLFSSVLYDPSFRPYEEDEEFAEDIEHSGGRVKLYQYYDSDIYVRLVNKTTGEELPSDQDQAKSLDEHYCYSNLCEYGYLELPPGFPVVKGSGTHISDDEGYEIASWGMPLTIRIKSDEYDFSKSELSDWYLKLFYFPLL